MRKGDRLVSALTPQRDRKSSAAGERDRLDETTDVRPQLVADAVAGPARRTSAGVSARRRRNGRSLSM